MQNIIYKLGSSSIPGLPSLYYLAMKEAVTTAVMTGEPLSSIEAKHLIILSTNSLHCRNVSTMCTSLKYKFAVQCKVQCEVKCEVQCAVQCAVQCELHC